MKKLILLFSALTLTLASTPNVAVAGNPAKGGQEVESSSFQGENDHIVSGDVKIVKKGDVQYLVFGRNFRFDGAPDPKIGFSRGDRFDQRSVFSGLNKDKGKQIYRLPVDFDASDYDEVTIWCDKFSVSLAEAKY